jgi:hypothetical protein
MTNKEFPLNSIDKQGELLHDIHTEFKPVIQKVTSQKPDWNFTVKKSGRNEISYRIYYKQELEAISISLSLISIYNSEPTIDNLHVIISCTTDKKIRSNMSVDNMSIEKLSDSFKDTFDDNKEKMENEIETLR